MANIRQVAQKAGVSIGTVSRVMNNRPGVGAETRRLVLDAAQELHYTFPKRFYVSSNNIIQFGFVNQPFGQDITSNPFYADVFHGVEQICRELHINLSYSTVGFTGPRLHALPPLFKENYVDGLFIVGGGIPQVIVEALRGVSQAPFVLVDNCFPDCCWDSVMTDNSRGIRLAMEYLIARGHRHIALVGGPGHPSIVERHDSYLEVLGRHQLTPIVLPAPHLSPEDGQWGVVEILRTAPETTAIVCSNDEQAVGALKKLTELGYRVPADFSLVGFDDINMVQFTSPPITTVCVDRLTMGQAAVQLLLDRIKFPNRPVMKIIVGVKLIERASVGAPRSHKLAPAEHRR